MSSSSVSKQPGKGKGKAVQLSEIDHCLRKPGMYIDTIEPRVDYHWRLNDAMVELLNEMGCKATSAERLAEIRAHLARTDTHQLLHMEDGDKVEWIPGLIKIVDEILVNAADQAQRTCAWDAGVVFRGAFAARTLYRPCDVVRVRGAYFRTAARDDDPGWLSGDEFQVDQWTPVHTNRMTRLEVRIDPEEGRVSVTNDGDCMDVAVDDADGIANPHRALGRMRAGTNFTQDTKQTVGGTHGVGSKGTNIWSSAFGVEIHDHRATHQSFQMAWSDNMRQHTQYTYKALKVAPAGAQPKPDSTRIWFVPDFAKFGSKGNTFSAHELGILYWRVVTLAGTLATLDIKVTLNGFDLSKEVRDFEELVLLHLTPLACKATAAAAAGEASASSAKARTSKPRMAKAHLFPPLVHEIVNDRWEYVVVPSRFGRAESVGFVNHVATSAGEHVSYLRNQLVDAAQALLPKKLASAGFGEQGKRATANQIKNLFGIFVNCRIENPLWGAGQAKEKLVTKPAQFGSTCRIDDKTVAAILRKLDIKKRLLGHYQQQEDQEGGKVDKAVKLSRNITGYPKLDDANLAGTKDGHLCTLVLTEGDSAKALAVSGISVVGRDTFGCYPLRGKLLNVRDASAKQIAENEEVNAIKTILGLRSNYDYNDVKELRYGSVMIFADEDHDGSHIKGLIINLFACLWPSLLRLPGFLVEFITPIVKCTRTRNAQKNKQKQASDEVVSFFSIPEYEAWLKEKHAGFHSKFYKGLGTSTALEAKEYFSNMSRHRLEFAYAGETDDQALDLAFSKSKADARKAWLARFEPGTFLSHTPGKSIPYAEFVNKELVLYSMASNARNLPSVVDGFTTSQRKCMFAAFNRNLVHEMKVAQLAAYVAEKTHYEHGEVSLCGTIIGLAQAYVGANNASLLLPNGQFGTRLEGGKDAASERYIFTCLSPLARALIPAADDVILNYLPYHQDRIEPDFFLPILPAVLINGAFGMGTGYSCNVCNYSPIELAAATKLAIQAFRDAPLDATDADLRALVAAALPGELTPWYRGFQGRIRKSAAVPGKFLVQGNLERLAPRRPDVVTFHISELPIKKWTVDYKVYLEGLVVAQKVVEFSEHHLDNTVSFVVDLTPEQAASAEASGSLYDFFRLNASLSTNNMVLFRHDGTIRHYATPQEILVDHAMVRLPGYVRRRAALMAAESACIARLANKVRFIRCINAPSNAAEHIALSSTSSTRLRARLVELDFLRIPSSSSSSHDAAAAAADEKVTDFNYLTDMSVMAQTLDHAASLESELEQAQQKLDKLSADTPVDMWERDIDHFLLALASHEAFERRQAEDSTTAAAAAANSSSSGGQQKTKKKLSKMSQQQQKQKQAQVIIAGVRVDDAMDDTPVVREKKPRKRKLPDIARDLADDAPLSQLRSSPEKLTTSDATTSSSSSKRTKVELEVEASP